MENEILKHLEAGEVLLEDKWVSIYNGFAARSPSAPGAENNNKEAPAAENIFNKKGIPWVVVSCETGEQHLAPDSLVGRLHQSGADDDNDHLDSWEKARRMPVNKIILLASIGIAVIAVVAFVIVKIAS
jgi:hypothetical protein